MPLIYLRHPQHGVKIASLDLEAEYDERNGWERFDPAEPEPAPVMNEMRRRGRVRREPEHDDISG